MDSDKPNDTKSRIKVFQEENGIYDISDLVLLLEMTKIARQKAFPLKITDFTSLIEG